MICLEVRLVRCSTASAPSRLPGLDRAVNPYRGCAHSCAYCYAQDVTRFAIGDAWGSIVEVKVNIVQMLKKELERGKDGVYGVGTVTDPYQPIEAKHGLTRGCLSMLKRYGAQASVLTKSSLVTRDIDLFTGWSGIEVGISIACVDERVSRAVEPDAPPPKARFEALSAMVDADVDVYLMAAPIIPGISDSRHLLESLIESAADAGVRRVMWDSWNPKPIAASRLRDCLEDHGLVLDGIEAKVGPQTQATLRESCKERDIQLISAF